MLKYYESRGISAVAFNSFDTLLAPFIKKDNMEYKQVKQNMQNFIYSINSNSRGGAEPSFTNISFDLTPDESRLLEPAIIAGEIMNFTYKDCQKEIDMINRAFFEIMIEGDAKGKPFSYPIPQYNIHKRFDWDNPNNDLLWEMAGKYGYPYFSNYINSDLDMTQVRAMCPLTSETKLFIKSGNSNATISEIGDAYSNQSKGTEYFVFTKDGWEKATINRTPRTKVFNIVFSNGANVKMGENHLQPTRDNGTLSAKYLTTDMWVPFNKKPISINTLDSDHDYIIETHTSDNHCAPLVDEDDNYHYFKITSIEEDTEYRNAFLYCVELDNEDKLFTLSNGLITHNCRLSLNLAELTKRNGGLFGSGDSTGSIGVVTIDLPRLAYTNQGNKTKFFKELDKILVTAKDSLEIKREWLNENILATRAIPAFCTYVGTLKNHFSTIGVVGENEMCENFFGEGTDIITEEGKAFALEVNEYVRTRLIDFQEETGNLYNYEASPSEGTCHRLAMKDREEFGDIITRGVEGSYYYTNSCHMPVSRVESIDHLFSHQNDLQTQFTGGTVVHAFLNGAISGEQAKHIVRTVCENYKVPYISLSPLNRYCPEHGYVEDRVNLCPKCGAELDLYQRITGYLRKVQNFNNGKHAEFEDRKQINI